MSNDNLVVLVVDDAPEIRYVIARVLRAQAPGWRVLADAADGEEGVAHAREEQPDVVLLDISMPVMDGLEALPLIREAAPHAVVIILSGFPSVTAERNALDAGAAAYLEKDDLVASLVPQIRAALADAQHGAPAEPSPTT